MCRRKFVWRQGTKYVVGLQKYWVTSKTVGSQHFPEALHVFQPSGLVRLVVRRRIKRGVFPREFSPSWKTFSWPIRGTRKNPLKNSRFVSYLSIIARNKKSKNLSRDRGRFGGQTQNCDSLLKICEVCTAMGRLIAPLSVSHCRYYWIERSPPLGE